METDEILVHCTLCWTLCTLNPGYHLLKDSWADPRLQQLPSYAQRLTSNKTIRWMTMRTWSPSHMQNLGWWDLAKLSCSIANGFMCFFTSNVRSTFYNKRPMTITIRPQERTRPISIRWCIPMIGLTPLTIKVTLRGTLFRECRFYKNHFQEPFPHTGKWNQPPTLQLITRSSRFRRRSSSLTRLLKSWFPGLYSCDSLGCPLWGWIGWQWLCKAQR